MVRMAAKNREGEKHLSMLHCLQFSLTSCFIVLTQSLKQEFLSSGGKYTHDYSLLALLSTTNLSV